MAWAVASWLAPWGWAQQAPPPVAPKPAVKQIEPGTVSDDYLGLLKCVADPWTKDAQEAPKLAAHLPMKESFDRLQAFDGGTDQRTRNVVNRLKTATKKQNFYEEMNRLGQGIMLQQAITESHTVTVWYNEAGQVTSTEQGPAVENNIGYGLGSRFLTSLTGKMQQRYGENPFTVAKLDTRQGAPFMYGQAPREPQMLTPRVQPGSIVLENTSGHALTDVTACVDLVLFSSEPNPCSYRLLYIPALQSGEKIYLSPDVAPNVPVDPQTAARIYRPPLALHAFAQDDDSVLREGGIVEIRINAWAHEAQQRDAVVKFPEAAKKAAAYELTSVKRTLARLYLPPVPDAKGRLSPAWTFVVEGARRVLALTPDDAALAGEAKAILANPAAAAQKQQAIFARDVRAFVQGTYAGKFTLSEKVADNSKMFGDDLFGQVAGVLSQESKKKKWAAVKAVNGEGESLLEITTIPGAYSLLVAKLSNPANPTVKRNFMGAAPAVDLGLSTVNLRSIDESDRAYLDQVAAGRPFGDPQSAPRWAILMKGATEGVISPAAMQATSPLSTKPRTTNPTGPTVSLKGASLLDGNQGRAGSKARVVTAPPKPTTTPAPEGPTVQDFNVCADHLTLDFAGGKLAGSGWAGLFEFPLSLERTARPTDAPGTAQQRAMQLYPDLAKPTSPLNQEFLRRVKLYQESKKDFFNDPEWPLKLAKESAEAIQSKPAP